MKKRKSFYKSLSVFVKGDRRWKPVAARASYDDGFSIPEECVLCMKIRKRIR